MAYNYEKDIDYSLLMEQAAKNKDYTQAAKYEQMRNAKIAGEGLGYEPTNKYSQYLMPSNYKGSGNGVYTWNNQQSGLLGQANQNSIDWWNADAAGKKTLADANKQIYSLLGGDIGYNAQTGTWSGVANQPISLKTGVDMAQPKFDVNEYLASNPKPTWNSQYGDRIGTLVNQILNREAFSYDLNSDPLFQAYKTQYNREGTRAMQDTLASVASGAGGMNSYAIGAAQQANNYHNAQLMDRIPELYQLAYSMYMDDLNSQRTDLNTLVSLDEVDYGRHRDDVSDWYTDRNFAYTDYRDKMDDFQWGTGFNYTAEQDAIDREWQQKEWDFKLDKEEYSRNRDKVGDELTADQTAYDRAMEMLLMGVMPDSTLLSQADISAEEAEAIRAKALGGIVPGAIDTGSNPTGDPTGNPTDGGYHGNGKLTEAQVKEMQKYYGVEADGKWGSKSKAAAGGKSADAAWQAYQRAMGTADRVDANSNLDNSLNTERIKQLQSMLGLTPDGIWGPKSREKAGGRSAREAWDYYIKSNTGVPEGVDRPAAAQVSDRAKQIASSLDMMRGQMGSNSAIANSIAVYVDSENLSDADARWLFEYFGYDPNEWLE